jgi:hypothetical protein
MFIAPRAFPHGTRQSTGSIGSIRNGGQAQLHLDPRAQLTRRHSSVGYRAFNLQLEHKALLVGLGRLGTMEASVLEWKDNTLACQYI